MGSAEEALKSRSDLDPYGTNARLLFALALRYQIEDIETVAANALTDGSDDKSCDLIYVDEDAGVAVIGQGYESEHPEKSEAKAKKASDLNTAATWLLARPLDELPDRLRSGAYELRQALKEKKVQRLEFWYVHNLPESENVVKELQSVEQTAKSIVTTNFADAVGVEIAGIEVGRGTLDEWYKALEAPILISESFTIEVPGGYETKGKTWRAYATAVQAVWLYAVFKKHRNVLFSANLRGYLGSRRSDSNINNGIKASVSTEPVDFWVYNNGLTALVHKFNVTRESNRTILKFDGLSIVNGAQTTGAIGSSESAPLSSMH